MASGNTLGSFQATGGMSSITNGALPLSTNNRYCLQFDPTTQQSAEFSWVVPRNYGVLGIAVGWTLTLFWAGNTATSGNVLWGASVERNAGAGNAITSDNFSTVVNAGGGAAAVNGSLGKLTYTAIALTDGTQINSVAVGDECRIKISRIAADGTDTMAGFANLLGFEVKET